MSSAIWPRLKRFLAITLILIAATIFGDFLGGLFAIVYSDPGADVSYESPGGILRALLQAGCSLMLIEGLCHWYQDRTLLASILRAGAWLALALLAGIVLLLVIRAVWIEGPRLELLFALLSTVAGTAPWVLAGFGRNQRFH